jgi:hypothetical protein
LVPGFLRTVLENCFEEPGVLCGQIWIDVELFSGSVATDPDSDEISQDTAQDPIVSNRNMRKVWRLSTYLGLFFFLRSHWVLTASDMATWWLMQWEQRYGRCERVELMSRERMLKEEEVKAYMLP